MNYRKIFTGIAALIAVTISLLSFFSGDPWQTMAGFWMLMWVMDANDTDSEISILEKRTQALETKSAKKLFKN